MKDKDKHELNITPDLYAMLGRKDAVIETLTIANKMLISEIQKLQAELESLTKDGSESEMKESA